VILVLSSVSLGNFSALTKLCAKDVTSTPEPALMEDLIFCAFALLVAAMLAAVVAVLDVLDVDALAAVVAMEISLKVFDESDRESRT